MTRRAPSRQPSALALRPPPPGDWLPLPLPLLLADLDDQGDGAAPIDACAGCGGLLADAGVPHRLAAADCRLCRVAACEPAAFTEPFCRFLRACPTVFHAIDHLARKLARAGYCELPARDDWAGRLRPGGKYYVTRNGSTLAALSVDRAYRPGNGVAMVAGHVDALTARLKPVSARPSRAGYRQLGVAPYAGGLNRTWWDRDLSIAGRVVVRDPRSGRTAVRLVDLAWPVAKIPTLAPHFGVGMFGDDNKETQAVPVVGLDDDAAAAEPLGPPGAFVNAQPPRLVLLVARQLGLDSCADILNWDLELYDAQPAQTCGLDRDLISAGRIDDKLCSWAALMALLAADDADDAGCIKLVALFDDEEVGSLLRQGARGNFLPLVVERAVQALAPAAYGPGLLGQTYARSFLVSADVTHAVHPNFEHQYLPDHAPRLNVGVAIAADPNANMTTDAVSTAILRRAADLCGARTQLFQIRNDSRSGGTIGPSLSSAMGVRAADAGIPQLSMHSVRATTGALDPGLGLRFFKGFLDHWERIDAEWEH